MTTPVFVDNVYGTLGSGAAATDLSLSLTAGHGVRFPVVTAGQILYATLLSSANVLEEIHITAHTANSDTLTVTRAANGTTAKAWTAGDRIECRLTSEGLGTFSTSAAAQSGSVVHLGTVAGTDAITGVLSPTLTAYVTGQYVFVTAAGTNTGATTVAIDGLAATAVKKNSAAGLVALVAGDIQSGGGYLFFYDGTQFVLINPAVTVVTQAQMEAATSNTALMTPISAKWAPSAAKVFLEYDGSASSILASSNIASVTKNGTGWYTVTFTTAFSTANYAVVFGTTQAAQVSTIHIINGGQLAGSIELKTLTHTNTGPYHAMPGDDAVFSVACYGDFA